MLQATGNRLHRSECSDPVRVSKFSLSHFQKSCYTLRIPPRYKGRIAIVTTREAGSDGRVGAQHP
jgi:hypothetical protein